MASPTVQLSPDSGPVELPVLDSASEPFHQTLWYDVPQVETSIDLFYLVSRTMLRAHLGNDTPVRNSRTNGTKSM